MSATRNDETMTNPPEGGFRSRVPPSEPMTTKGHAPGVKVGNDAVREFNAETYSPGTAPAKDTFRPDPRSEVTGQANSTRTAALDMPGATSGQVYNDTEFGRPMEGQTSREQHGAHAGKRKKERTGLEGLATVGGVEEIKGTKGKSGQVEGGESWPGAGERLPTTADEVAAERD